LPAGAGATIFTAAFSGAAALGAGASFLGAAAFAGFADALADVFAGVGFFAGAIFGAGFLATGFFAAAFFTAGFFAAVFLVVAFAVFVLGETELFAAFFAFVPDFVFAFVAVFFVAIFTSQLRYRSREGALSQTDSPVRSRSPFNQPLVPPRAGFLA